MTQLVSCIKKYKLPKEKKEQSPKKQPELNIKNYLKNH